MLLPNTILQNRYRIVRQLAQGGMGTVYEAIDLRFDSQVAIKESHYTEVALRKQFAREAHLLYRLRHPAIARVIDHFSEGAGQFLVMDFIAGEDLGEVLRRRGVAFSVKQVVCWADQLLDALAYLHSQKPQVVHRDIKPLNLKLTNENKIVLLDFGLAKGYAGQFSRGTTGESIRGYTAHYAPLEQIQGTGTDERSDLYSLGATLYHLMTGVIPKDVLTRLEATTDGRPDPLLSPHNLNPEISGSLAFVLNKAMAISRSHRFASANEMRKALREASRNLFPDEPFAEHVSTIIIPTPAQPSVKATRILPQELKPGARRVLRVVGNTSNFIILAIVGVVVIFNYLIKGTADLSANSNQPNIPQPQATISPSNLTDAPKPELPDINAEANANVGKSDRSVAGENTSNNIAGKNTNNSVTRSVVPQRRIRRNTNTASERVRKPMEGSISDQELKRKKALEALDQ